MSTGEVVLRHMAERRVARAMRGLGDVLPTRVIDDTQQYPDSKLVLPVHLFPPHNAELIDQIAYAAIPAIGGAVNIISFPIPPGRNAILKKFACNFVGGGWVEGSGDMLWRILIDGAAPPNAASYDSIPASLGSPANPVEVPMGIRVFENQVVTVVGFNNAAGPHDGIVVAGQLLGARIVGYMYPRELEDDDVWI